MIIYPCKKCEGRMDFVMKDFPVRKNIRLKNYDYSSTGCYFVTICVKNRHELLGRIVVGNAHPGVPYVKLTEIGEMVKQHIDRASMIYSTLTIDKYTIMPNHIHMIVVIENGTPGCASPAQNGTPGCASPTQNGTPGCASPTQNGTPGCASPTQNGTPGCASSTQNGTPGCVFPTQNGTPGCASPTQNGTPGCASPTKSTLANMINALKSLTTRQCGYSIWQRAYHDHIIRNDAEYRKIWHYIDVNPSKWQEDRYYI